MFPLTRRGRYLFALLVTGAGVVALLLFPEFLHGTYLAAWCVSLIVLVVAGVGPALVAELIIIAATVYLAVEPSRSPALGNGEGARLVIWVVCIGLADVLAWRLERIRGVSVVQQEALRENEARYRHLLEQASDGIVLAQLDGRLLLVNQRICEMLGYSESELLAQPLTAVYAPGELERLPLGWDRLPEGSVVLRERVLRRQDGSTFAAELSLRRSAEGLVQAIVRDITERRRSEEAFRSEHALLDSILATSVAGILVVTPEGRVVFLNPTAEAALGITREQIADRTELPPGWRFFRLDGSPLPESERPARRVVATGQPVQDVRLVIERPDRQRRVLSLNAAPLKDGADRITSVVLSLSDITERERAQRAIEEREEQLQRITAAVPGVVYQYVVAADGTRGFTFVSGRARDLFGVTPEAIIADANRLWGLVEPEDYADMRAAFDQAIRSRESWSNDFRVVAVGGTGEQRRWLRAIATAAPGREPGSVSLVGVVVDITDQKRLEEELRQSQKMDSLGRLAGGVAHDFNNLLTVIRGYADVLSGELSEEDPRLSEVREIRRAADRATSLTRQLLAVSRRQMLVPREVDLNALVQEMERMLRRVIGEDIQIVTRTGPDLGWVRADAGQLEQVLLNLAVNARDAMPGGGTLSIETSRVAIAPGREEPGARGVPAGEYVVLRVSDTGVGMDRQTQGKIFEPFFTTKPLGEGTGLGLSTVYGIIQQSSGAITVESEPGSGTSFRVFLPRIAEPARVPREAGPPRPAGAGLARRASILLVEDDDGVRQLTARVLEQYGYGVVEAQHAAEALELLSSASLRVDAVVSDIVMPGLSGTELISRLRGQWPELPVLFLSGYTGSEVSGEVQLGPRQAFLQKPFSPDALATALEELLADAKPPATAG